MNRFPARTEGEATPCGKYVFRETLAAHAEAFFEQYLRHSKGEWAGQLFVLSPWQRWIVRELFGWIRVDNGTRRYRMAYIEIPRKNGKSTFSAGLALYLALCDDERALGISPASRSRISVRSDGKKTEDDLRRDFFKRGSFLAGGGSA